MNLPQAISVTSWTAGVLTAILCLGIARAPAWREMRWFALVSVAAGNLTLCNVAVVSDAPEVVLRWAFHVGMACGGLHTMAWLPYMAAVEGRALRRWEKVLCAALVTTALLFLAPGVLVSETISRREVTWLGLTYRDAMPTTAGAVVFGLYCLGLCIPLFRFAERWRRGVPAAGAHVLGLSFLVFAAVSDSLAASGAIAMPYLLDTGFLVVVAAAGGTMISRFVNTARGLEALSEDLERTVAERTGELARAREALLQAEKLATIGRLSAGVAHEINNPAAVVAANMAYLQEHLNAGEPFPDDTAECIKESLSAMQRINRIVRQLLDAGRTAGTRRTTLRAFRVTSSVEAAVGLARTTLAGSTTLTTTIPEDLHALGDPELLEQVLVNLVVNAAQAVQGVPGRGRIQVSAERCQERVVILVRDDGPGISAETMERLFEPFFTTKPQGSGTGLGLAVSLGLMRSQHGNLSVASTSPQGTVMQVELPSAGKPPVVTGLPSAAC
ncbi:MAG: ATP-binding protein [Myxococcota bacterium]